MHEYMCKMSDKDKWNDLWFVQESIGNFYNLIKTFSSWNPDYDEKKHYLSTGKYPLNKKIAKHILEICDYRNTKPEFFNIHSIFMTISADGSCWGAFNENKFMSNKFDGVLIIQYQNEDRDISIAKLYLITRFEFIEDFAVYGDGRIHLKSNNNCSDKYLLPASIDKYVLPLFDDKGNNNLKWKLFDICDRLHKQHNNQKPFSKYVYTSNYINMLCK